MTLHYELGVHDPSAHEFELVLTIDRPDPAGQVVALPAWIPGSYMIRDFARNIVAISASDAGGAVALRKLDKQSWCADGATGPLRIRYLVYAWDLSVRAACLDPTRGYFNGPSVFLRVVGQEGRPCELRLLPPPGLDGWSVSTTLPAEQTDARGFGRYRAADYAALLDHPVEMGEHSSFGFSVQGVPHTFTVTEGGVFDATRLQSDLERICAQHAALFGELPVERYLFLTLALGEGYGGLEHADSTSLMCRRADLPPPGMGAISKGYRQFMALCSHEYFHLWNVKRIRPLRLAQADLSTEAYTGLLWAFEGITSYYDELALLRSGCLALGEYLDLLATTVTRVVRGPGRLRQSIADSSFDAWTKFYKQDENAPNAVVSYYAKGALVAFGLDITLRLRSNDRLALDDLMRTLWLRHGKTGIGVPEGGIERLVTELLGEPLDDFFAAYVYGTRELPLQDWFGALGIDYRLRPARDAEDPGGFNAGQGPPVPAPASRALGARLADAAGFTTVTHVLHGGAAHRAGVAAGDRLVALAGEYLDSVRLPDLLGRHPVDSVQELHVLRRDRLLSLALPILEAPCDTCEFSLPETSAAAVLARRQAWAASGAATDA